MRLLKKTYTARAKKKIPRLVLMLEDVQKNVNWDIKKKEDKNAYMLDR